MLSIPCYIQERLLDNKIRYISKGGGHSYNMKKHLSKRLGSKSQRANQTQLKNNSKESQV